MASCIHGFGRIAAVAILANGLAKGGSGRLLLTGSNSYSGGTRLAGAGGSIALGTVRRIGPLPDFDL